MLNPHHKVVKALAILQDGVSSYGEADADISYIVRCLRTADTDPVFQQALSIYRNPYKRRYIEAYLLVSTPVESAIGLGMPVELLELYARFFFDRSLLRDKLDRFCYVADISDPEDRRLKEFALAMGHQFLSWHIGSNVQMSSEEVLNRLLVDAYGMARLGMKKSSVASKESKESYHWATLAARIAEAIERRKVVGAQEDVFDTIDIAHIFDDGLEDSLDIAIGDIVRG